MTLPIIFGANIDPLWNEPGEPLRLARFAESLGLDLVTIQDHPYQPRFFETWTLLTHLAAGTESIAFVPTVLNLPLRPPAMLAKAAASLDLLSGGRVRLGLGAGGFYDPIVAMDGPRRTAGESVDALSEGIDVIRAMWSGERAVRYDGTHYHLRGVHPGPTPHGNPGIWLGAYGPRMLELTGAKADGWLPSHGYLPLEKVPASIARIKESAERAGRDPNLLRMVHNIAGAIGPESATPFGGSVDQWIDQLVSLVRAGMNGFALWPAGDIEQQLAVFAQEVAPAVRAAI